LSLLGTLKTGELATAIAMHDKAMIARAPGIGLKVAERIVTELKDKTVSAIDPAAGRLADALEADQAPRPMADAISALVNLGYGAPQATAAVVVAAKSAGENADAASLIRLGLKELAR
jgi:Holliday junction DNA helicase RuvA